MTTVVANRSGNQSGGSGGDDPPRPPEASSPSSRSSSSSSPSSSPTSSSPSSSPTSSSPSSSPSPGAAIWFTGLPGSGKSAVAGAVCAALATRGFPVTHLLMDERRKAYFPRPTYSDEEREAAYGLFVEEAAGLVGRGRIVLMDGSAPKKAMRDLARARIERFAEVHVSCSVATAMSREAARPGGLVMAGLYAKAISRKATGREYPGLGRVIGVDVPFEVDPAAELVVDSEALSVAGGAGRVMDFLTRWLPQR